MESRIVIYSSPDYAENVKRMVKAITAQGYPHPVVLDAHNSHAPRCRSPRPWLDVSTCWFEWVFRTITPLRTIILDADLQIIGDISELFSSDIQTPLAMVPDHYDRWQTGVVVINNHLIPSEFERDLFRLIPTQEWDKGDQSILNACLVNTPIPVHALSRGLSWCAPDGKPTEETRILHFHGIPKPWQPGYPEGKHPYKYDATPL